MALRRQAVLFRASHHSMMLEAELSARHIPFHKYGGRKFVETAHVKDLLAFLRLAENRATKWPRAASASDARRGAGQRGSSSSSAAESGGDFSCGAARKPPAGLGPTRPAMVSLLQALAKNDDALPAQVVSRV